MPTPSAWSSWRPGSFPGPTPAQWRTWLPRKGTKGKGKGKKGGKSSKGADIGWLSPPLGSLNQYQDQHQGGDLWIGMSYLNVVTQRPGKGPSSRAAEILTFASKNPYKILYTEDDDDEYEVSDKEVLSNHIRNSGAAPLSVVLKKREVDHTRNSGAALLSAVVKEKEVAAETIRNSGAALLSACGA